MSSVPWSFPRNACSAGANRNRTTDRRYRIARRAAWLAMSMLDRRSGTLYPDRSPTASERGFHCPLGRWQQPHRCPTIRSLLESRVPTAARNSAISSDPVPVNPFDRNQNLTHPAYRRTARHRRHALPSPASGRVSGSPTLGAVPEGPKPLRPSIRVISFPMSPKNGY